MTHDPVTSALAGLAEPARTAALSQLRAFCDELALDAALFDADELATATEDAIAAASGDPSAPAFADRLRFRLLGYLHEHMVEHASEDRDLPTGLPRDHYEALQRELIGKFGPIPRSYESLYVYGAFDPRTGRTFDVEIPGPKFEVDATLDAGAGPLGFGRELLPRLRKAVEGGRVCVSETSGATSRRMTVMAFAEVLEESAEMQVMGPMTIR
jgi:hypothetical protein